MFKNAGLKSYSRVGETEEAFTARCDAEAEARADAETAALRDKYEAKLQRLRRAFDAAERRVEELEVDLQGAREGQLIEGAGALIDILRGRRSTRSITGSARKRAAARSKEQRLRSAQEKVHDKWEAMAELEEELLSELEQINDRWEAIATEVEPVEVGLEKNDIHVEHVTLVWIPV